jgi:IS5 family transposase
MYLYNVKEKRMKYTSQNKYKQLTLDMFRSSLKDLDKTNRWVILGDTLPWAELEKIYNSRLNNIDRGAGNKPARMVIGAMIIKHKMNLSDEETIQIIRENPYMQYLCGLSELTDKPLFDPSLFVTVRKRITEEEINEMSLRLLEEEQRRKAGHDDGKGENPGDGATGAPSGHKGESAGTGDGGDCFSKEYTDSQGRRHKGVLKIDATCANAEVRYPVDVDIIMDGCKVIDRYIHKLGDMLGIKARTSYTDARRMYLLLVKMKKKGGRLVRLTKSYMLSCLNKDLSRIVDIFVDHKGSKSLLARHEQRILTATFDMYAQQLEMSLNNIHQCADRIVSIFQPHLRPIVRGKAKARTEFGAKIGASICQGYTFIDHFSWDAYNESSDLEDQVSLYKKRFGCLPATVLADKIYMNKANRKYLRDEEIKNFCKPLGRPPKAERPPEYYQDMAKAIGDRNEVECSFGTGKRIYRADNIRAKLPETARCWTGMCYFVKNVMKFLRELCPCLFEKIVLWLHFLCFYLFRRPVLIGSIHA